MHAPALTFSACAEPRFTPSVSLAVAAAVRETLDAIADNPRRPGKRLSVEHDGRWSARRGPYRVIHELVEDERPVRVIATGQRRDVYRSR